MTLQDMGPTPADLQALRTELDELLRARQFATQRERRLAEVLRQSREPLGGEGRSGQARRPDPELVRQLAQAQVFREGLGSRCLELSDRLLAMEDQLMAEQFRSGSPATASPTAVAPLTSDPDDAPGRSATAHGGTADGGPTLEAPSSDPQTDLRPRRGLRFGRRKATPTTFAQPASQPLSQPAAPLAADPADTDTATPPTAGIHPHRMRNATEAPPPSETSRAHGTSGFRATSGAPDSRMPATQSATPATPAARATATGAFQQPGPPPGPTRSAGAFAEKPRGAGPASTSTERHLLADQHSGPGNPQVRIGHELAALVGRINGLNRRGATRETAAVVAHAAMALAPADVVRLAELLRSDGPSGSAGYLARSTARSAPDHAVGTLAELRRAGLVDEAAELFHILRSVPGSALPALLAALERAGQTADGQTILWERASAAPAELAGLAAGLLEAGRTDDVRNLLRQAAGRPIREVAEIATALDPEAAAGLTEAVARIRSASDTSHYAGAIRSDSERYTALLDAVATLDESRARATIAALRSAGLPTDRPARPRSRRRSATT